jgi:hypothetical protein
MSIAEDVSYDCTTRKALYKRFSDMQSADMVSLSKPMA